MGTFVNLINSDELTLTLQVLGIEKEFYLFKKKLTALYKRKQLLNGLDFAINNNGEICMEVEDIRNPEISLGEISLNKEAFKYYNNVFDIVLKNSKWNLLFFSFEGHTYILGDKIERISRKFEKITGLDFFKIREKYFEYYH